MRHTRAWRWTFIAFALLLLGAMYGFSLAILRAERATAAARAEAKYRETLRRALWRMDARLIPLLAREAARPYFEYRSYSPPGRPHTGFPRTGGPDDGWTPSPLLGVAPAPIRLHFQLDPDGNLTSPQVPPSGSGPHLELGAFRSNRRVLRELDRMIEQGRFRKDAAAAEELVAGRLEAPAHDRDATGGSVDDTPEESTMRSGEFDARAREVARAAAQGEARPAAGGASTRTVKEIGPVVTLWIGDPTSDGEKLAFVRRVRLRDGTFLQGFVVDWELLQADLLEAIGDLFSEAELVQAHRHGPSPDRRVGLLATVPAALEVGWTMRQPVSPVTPTRIALIVGWLAACSTIVATGIALRRRLR